MSNKRKKTNANQNAKTGGKSGCKINSSISSGEPATGRRRWLVLAGLNLLTVAMLSFSFAPYSWSLLAFAALVPWMLALHSGVRTRWAVLAGTLTGLVFWAVNLYWLWWITLEGYIAAVFYLSMYWLVAGWVLRAAMRKKLPMFLALPVVWVALEFVRNYVISGFPWFYLAHSQWAHPAMIQIADITGQYGVSFVVAMVNGVIVDVVLAMRQRNCKLQIANCKLNSTTKEEKEEATRGRDARDTRGQDVRDTNNCESSFTWQSAIRSSTKLAEINQQSAIVFGVVVTGLVLVFTLVYGSWRLGQRTTEVGPVIGIVQKAYPIALGMDYRESTPEKVLDTHMAASKAFVGTDCDLVVWAETMLPRWMNNEGMAFDPDTLSGDVLRSAAARFFCDSRVWDTSISEDALRTAMKKSPEFELRRQAGGQIGQLSRQIGCPILAGGSALHRNDKPVNKSDIWNVYNSALLFDETGRCQGEYAKMHLVPFSEFVPFKKSWLWLHETLRTAVPDVMEQLEPGTEYKVFEIDAAKKHADETSATRAGKMPATRTTEPSATQKPWRIASPICYEGTFDNLCRPLVFQNGKKSVDVLVNMSNDGWFVWKGSRRGSSENPQHMVQYAFRAVENRVPVVRVVNTGMSASFDSDGRLIGAIENDSNGDIVEKNVLLKDGVKPSNVDVVWPQVLVDSRVSLYSRIGDIFALAVAAAAVSLAGWLIWKRHYVKETP